MVPWMVRASLFSIIVIIGVILLIFGSPSFIESLGLYDRHQETTYAVIGLLLGVGTKFNRIFSQQIFFYFKHHIFILFFYVMIQRLRFTSSLSFIVSMLNCVMKKLEIVIHQHQPKYFTQICYNYFYYFSILFQRNLIFFNSNNNK